MTAPRTCDHCGIDIAGLPRNSYIDRHGDIADVCDACYAAASNPPEAPDLRRRDRIVACGLVVLAILVLLATHGCAAFAPRIDIVMLDDGRIAIEHIDTDDAPAACGDRSEWAGCHQLRDGIPHIWRSSLSAAHTRRHERAHAMGMQHGPWTTDHLGRRWARVTHGGGHYQPGQWIVIDARGEFLLAAAP